MNRAHVLIIEDVADIRDTLRDLLELSGYSVRTAENGLRSPRARPRRRRGTWSTCLVRHIGEPSCSPDARICPFLRCRRVCLARRSGMSFRPLNAVDSLGALLSRFGYDSFMRNCWVGRRFLGPRAPGKPRPERAWTRVDASGN